MSAPGTLAGLKPYTAYKDSGVPWLGQVPRHWETKPLKRWVSINAEVLPETTAPDHTFRYMDIGSVGTGFLTQPPQQLSFDAAPSRARRVVHKGDTIVSTVRTYLRSIYFIDAKADDLVCSTGFAVLTPHIGTLPKFVGYLAQSNQFTDRVTADSVGIA
jgi:type I restriction enzyme S subunit